MDKQGLLTFSENRPNSDIPLQRENIRIVDSVFIGLGHDVVPFLPELFWSIPKTRLGANVRQS